MFTGVNRGLHRRSNFRRRFWLPALTGDEKKGWSPLNVDLHFHDLRHTHETWLVEDHVPRIMRLERLGHKRNTLAALQRRWEQDGGWSWSSATDPETDAA